MMNAVTLMIRITLSVLLSLLFLFAWAFPHLAAPATIMPLHGAPEPDIFQQGGYFDANKLWMLSLLGLYIVSAMGQRKNLVWFSGWFTALLLGALLWPFLQVWYPEYLWSPVAYLKAGLSWGMLYTAIFVAASMVLRLGLLPFLFPQPLAPHEGNEVELDRLDVSKARTVREIAASKGRVRASFLFGEADKGLVARFYATMRSMMFAKLSRLYLITSILSFIGLWFYLYPKLVGTVEHGLARDRERMYQVAGVQGGRHLLTTSSLHAAMRVLAPIASEDKLRGMTIKQAEKYLGLTGLDPALIAQLRDETPINTKSAGVLYGGRTRFLTLEDGTRRLILYLRLGADKDTINFAELEEEGWNPRVDEARRILSTRYQNVAF